MRLLLDECVPRTLAADLAEFGAEHVGDRGWRGRANGELLRLMYGAGFDSLLTVDQNLGYQQNLLEAGLIIAVLIIAVLVARSNRRPDLLPLLPELRRRLPFAKPGDLLRVSP